MLLLGGLLFSLRAVLSGVMMILLPLSLIYQYKSKTRLFNSRPKNIFFLACSLFFLVQASGILYAAYQTESLKDIRGKLPLLAVPLILCNASFLTNVIRKKILDWFCIAAVLVCIYLLIAAFYRYYTTGISSRFFYHEFSDPIRHNAVVLSILIFICFVYTIENGIKENYILSIKFHTALQIIFFITLLLLASKLILLFTCSYLVYLFFFKRNKNIKRKLIIAVSLLAIILLVLFINSPVKDRFTELTTEKKVFLNKEDISPALYLNGLQFRLLQFKLVPEILSENKAWLAGVSSGDAQSLLDKKYLQYNLYHGDGISNKRGFLGYYTHNQFLESFLQSGLIGLLSFVLICCAMINLAVKSGTRENWLIILLLLCYCFTESVLETQYTIFIFTFFPLFFFKSEPEI